MGDERLTHIDENGKARMVDVGEKPVTRRRARASAQVVMKRETAALIAADGIAKGDVFAVARIAGIQGAKRTDELIPLCHSLPIDRIDVDFSWAADDGASAVLQITSEATVLAKTGVEMEALTACSVAALTVYDMCKAVDREIEIRELRLIEKTGGKSDFNRA